MKYVVVFGSPKYRVPRLRYPRPPHATATAVARHTALHARQWIQCGAVYKLQHKTRQIKVKLFECFNAEGVPMHHLRRTVCGTAARVPLFVVDPKVRLPLHVIDHKTSSLRFLALVNH